MTHRYPERACLNCGHKIDAADSLTTADAPSEGDVMVCIKCAALMIYGNAGAFRLPTPEERAEVLADRDTINTLEMVRHAAYVDPTFGERRCEACGKTYQGPALYCSFECAVGDA
jgi:protein-arginine kinase activator protein McsA